MNPVSVDLWQWELSGDVPAEEARVLSADERARADRFVFPQHRARFIRGRARLREILGLYVGLAPEDIAFALSAYNKPSLANPLAPPLNFNLSHSGDLAVLGVSADVELGVDVEWIRPLKEDIAGRYFSPRECAVLRALPPDHQPRAFFECWTRKEAYIKASGEGLSLPLDSFEVAFGPGEAARFVRIDEPTPQAPDEWRLVSFEPAPGCIGAIAAKTMDAELAIKQRQ